MTRHSGVIWCSSAWKTGIDKVIDCKIFESADLKANLAALPDRLENRVMRKAMGKAGRVVVAAAKNVAPRRTGALKRSIKSKLTKQGNAKIYVDPKMRIETATASGAVRVHQPSKIAHLVEFGTVNAAAHPFMRPALDTSRGAAFQAAEVEAKKQFDKMTLAGGSGKWSKH
ncbi:MAG: HK97 gp10 family phage protein [Victivallaceae bacterium]|nr:HK97 gp10 family phage protein [Victivallaceae bacterium]